VHSMSTAPRRQGYESLLWPKNLRSKFNWSLWDVDFIKQRFFSS
jgi:hypothetical protein